jgi:hypothetical protein
MALGQIHAAHRKLFEKEGKVYQKREPDFICRLNN